MDVCKIHRYRSNYVITPFPGITRDYHTFDTRLRLHFTNPRLEDLTWNNNLSWLHTWEESVPDKQNPVLPGVALDSLMLNLCCVESIKLIIYIPLNSSTMKRHGLKFIPRKANDAIITYTYSILSLLMTWRRKGSWHQHSRHWPCFDEIVLYQQ